EKQPSPDSSGLGSRFILKKKNPALAGDRYGERLLHSLAPITRSPTLMHHCRNVDSVRLHFVKDRERKTRNESLANFSSVDPACLWESLNVLSCFFDYVEEVRAEAFALRFVVPRLLDHSGMRFGMKDDSHCLR